MIDWVDVVRGASVAAGKHQPVSDSDGTPHVIPAGLRILRSLAEGTALTDRENIRFNLDTAAIYLLRILSETPQSGQLAEVRVGRVVDDAIQYRYSSVVRIQGC